MARITAELTSGLLVNISNGRHVWRADEPAQAGGDDVGPNPYELLLGALAACTCITLQLYCRHKGLPLKSVSASYEYSRVHAEDCEECENPKRGFIDHVSSRIRIAGEFDDAQRQRLAQIAERRPVHKTLANGIRIHDQVEFGI
jgi:putative redox protein